MVGRDKTKLSFADITVGAELSLYVIFFIFLGYFIGNEISKIAGMLGTVIGAFLGALFAIRRCLKIMKK